MRLRGASLPAWPQKIRGQVRRHSACEVERHSIDFGARVCRLKMRSGFVSVVAVGVIVNHAGYGSGSRDEVVREISGPGKMPNRMTPMIALTRTIVSAGDGANMETVAVCGSGSRMYITITTRR